MANKGKRDKSDNSRKNNKHRAPAKAASSRSDQPSPLPTVETTKKTADGRRAALECLDLLLAREDNIQKLNNSLQDVFDIAPAKFFQDFVIPLTPKESLVQVKGDAKAPVRIIMEGGE